MKRRLNTNLSTSSGISCEMVWEPGLPFAVVSTVQEILSAMTPAEVCLTTIRVLFKLINATTATIALNKKTVARVVCAGIMEKPHGVTISLVDSRVPEQSISSQVRKQHGRIQWQQGSKDFPVARGWLTLPCYLGVPVLDDNQELFATIVIGFCSIEDLNERNTILTEVFASTFYKAYRNAMIYNDSVLQGQAMEQERIAHELHDSVAQSLFFASLKLEDLCVDKSLDEKNHAVLRRVKVVLEDAEEQLRRIIYESATHLSQPTLSKIIEAELAEHDSKGGVVVDLQVQPIDGLAAQTLTAVRTAIHESLANVRKHSQATQVRLRLAVENNMLLLSVRDNGKGISDHRACPRPEDRLHFGLANIRKLVESLGGHFSADSNHGEKDGATGTAICIALPLSLEQFNRRDYDGHDRHRVS